MAKYHRYEVVGIGNRSCFGTFWHELPITLACGSSTPEVVNLLLAYGASLHHSDALHIVAEDQEHRFRKVNSSPMAYAIPPRFEEPTYSLP